MREPQRRTIGAWVYSVRPMPAGQGLALMARIAKLLGPGVSALVGPSSGDGAIARAVGGLLERVQPDEVVDIARTLAAHAECSQAGGRPASVAEVFDVHFAGDYGALVDFITFALEVNYGPFVAGLKTRAAPGAGGGAAA